MPDKKGKVYIVGAGPGDPGLITIKAADIIRKADVIVYDFLANPELLNLAKRQAEKICVGKKDGLHLLAQARINKLLYERAKRKKAVIRLKGGDPFIFSRGIEEALYLKTKKVNFEIIAGITSAFAAPQSFGIPLTRRGRFSSVAVLTGRRSDGKAIDAPDCDTLIYLMGVANIKNIVKAVLKSGKGKDTPCAFIERGTLPEERVVAGNLADIVKKAVVYRVKPPAVFVVGEVVGYGKRIYGHKYKNN